MSEQKRTKTTDGPGTSDENCPTKPLRHVDRGRNRVSTCAFADTVARAAIAKYRELVPDWESSAQTVIAAFLLLHATSQGESDLEVVALGVGTKYMSARAIAASEEGCAGEPGVAVRDSHAEVLARRAFRLYLAREMQRGADSTLFAENHDEQISHAEYSCRLRDSVSVHLYTSSMPCGNACVRKWANGRREVHNETLAPKECPVQVHPSFSAHARAEGQIAPMWKKDELDGPNAVPRDTSDQWCPAGVTVVTPNSSRVQRVEIPPVSDAHESSTTREVENTPVSTTTSRRLLSCSDKIARWNVLGLQGKRLSRCLAPVYLSSITIGRKFNRPHAERALCCRLEACRPKQLSRAANHRVNHPAVLCTAVKLDERAIEADANVQFDSDGCMWWSKASSSEHLTPEWLHGPSGVTLAGQVSALSSSKLAAEEELGCKCRIVTPHETCSPHNALAGESEYILSKQWLFRKGGLFELCKSQ
eukprot:1187744-Prorocentrum_minimum.AAC.4